MNILVAKNAGNFLTSLNWFVSQEGTSPDVFHQAMNL